MNKKKITLLFIISYIAYSSIYVSRLNLSVASPLLQSLNLMSKVQIGTLGSIFFFTYSFGQLFNGTLGDKIRPRRMLLIGLTTAGLCNVLIGFMPPLPAIFLLWGLNGIAQSMIWGPLLRTVSAQFSPKKRSVVASFLVSSVAVGSVLGIVIASKAATAFGVCAAFYIPGAFTLLASLLVFLFFRVQSIPVPSNHVSFRNIFKIRELRMILLPAMIHGVLKDNVNLWVVDYFMDTFSIDVKQVSLYVFIVPILGLVGRLAYPPIYRVFGQKEHRVSVAAFLVCIGAVVPLLFKNISPICAMVCLSIIAAAVQIINTSMLTEFPIRFHHTGNVSQIAGVMDFATYMGAGISTAIYGFVLERFGYGVMYTSWGIISVIAIILLTVLEKHTEQTA